MNREDRAKQFAPFEALKGLREALRKKEEQAESLKKIEISDEKTTEIQKELCKVQKGDKVYIKFFNKGVYQIICGTVTKNNFAYKFMIVDDVKVFFDDVYEISIEND